MGLISRVSSRTYRQNKMAELAQALKSQNIWYQAAQYREAEIKLAKYNMGILSAGDSASASVPASKTANMIADLKNDLASASNDAVTDLAKVLDRVAKLEEENNTIRSQLQAALARLEKLEVSGGSAPTAAAPVKESPKQEEEDDDDDSVDLFGSDSEDDGEAERVKAERIAAYNAKKAAKEAVKGKTIAKSSISFDVKPWDDETDLKEVENMCRAITMEGLVWGSAQLKPIGYGIMKLRITCVVEDDKVSSDDLVEKIEGFEDHVQSVDIAAFQKI